MGSLIQDSGERDVETRQATGVFANANTSLTQDEVKSKNEKMNFFLQETVMMTTNNQTNAENVRTTVSRSVSNDLDKLDTVIDEEERNLRQNEQ